MEPQKTYQYLEELAEKIGISVRYEDLSNPEFTAQSGLCRVRGRFFYYMDTSKDLTQTITALSECLSQMDLDGVYVMPAVRGILERCQKQDKKDNK
jgi:hypothetical protein